MKKLIALASMLLIAVCSLNAQNTKQIKGKVVDDSTGNPLPGTSITVAGTKKAVKADEGGNYTISIPDDGKKHDLSFSYSGYLNKTIATDGNSVNVRLVQEVRQGEEVVVIGYQTVKRKDALASVSSVNAKDLKDIPINSVAEALNGRLAGVTATTAEGSPDAEVRVRVRNGISITGDNSPLYIVDGVQVENGLSSVVLQDIQSIDVLKDAAATAIYGARGANGVIIITTKSGKAGKLKVTYNGFYGVKYLPKTLGVLSPYDYVIYESERTRGSSTDSASFVSSFGKWDTLINYQKQQPVDWQDEVMGVEGYTQNQNVGVSGGNKKTTFNFGYTYNNDKAIVLNSNYRRNQLSLKIDHKFSEKLKGGISARYNSQNVFGAGVSDDRGSSYSRLRNAVKYRPYLSNAQSLDDNDPLADPNVGNSLSLVNPIKLAFAEYKKKTTQTFNLTANISYNISKRLSFKSTLGFERKNIIDRLYSDTLTSLSTISGGKRPLVELDTTIGITINNSNVFTYSLKNLKKQHDIDILVGEETYELTTDVHQRIMRDYAYQVDAGAGFDLAASGIGNNFAGYPKYTKSKYTSLSFFGRINYSYLKKYLFTFNFRADGASKFGDGYKWGYFPGGSFAWRVKNENFLKNVSFINDLKFRAGFGVVGNNRIDDYRYISTFASNTYYYGLNNQLTYGYNSVSLVNENLKWESTVNRNYGVDITLFKNRIDLSIDYYSNSSKDLLLNVPIAATYGYSTQFQNIGKTSNKGWEFQLNANIIRNKNIFSWTANFNISTNKNRVEALGAGQNFFYPAASWGVSGQLADYITKIGDPVGSMYGLVTDGYYTLDDFNYAGGIYTLKTGVVSNAGIIGTVQPGSIKFRDLNNDGIVDVTNDRTIIGNPTPKFTGGLNQQFTYKNWDMSIFLNFSYGNDVYNANKIEFTNGYTPRSNLLDVMANRWRTIDPTTGATVQWISGGNVYGVAPAQLAAINSGANIWQPIKSAGAFVTHSWAIEDGSFLRVNNVTLGYSLPIKSLVKLGISKLRVYATGNNLAILTKYTGFDPEVSVRKSPLTPGLDYSAYPKSRSFIFGVNVSF